MGREFNKAVRERFAAGFEAIAPDYARQPAGPSPYAWAGETAWSCAPEPGVLLWVMLVPSPKGYNEFGVELGWSRLGRYPRLSMRPSAPLPGPDRREWAGVEYLCRLDKVAPGVPQWWRAGGETGTADGASTDAGRVSPTEETPEPPQSIRTGVEAALAKLTREQAMRAAAPLVDEALAALRTHGLPYLAAWAGTRPGPATA